jgi:hypothetical protein
MDLAKDRLEHFASGSPQAGADLGQRLLGLAGARIVMGEQGGVLLEAVGVEPLDRPTPGVVRPPLVASKQRGAGCLRYPVMPKGVLQVGLWATWVGPADSGWLRWLRGLTTGCLR